MILLSAGPIFALYHTCTDEGNNRKDVYGAVAPKDIWVSLGGSEMAH